MRELCDDDLLGAWPPGDPSASDAANQGPGLHRSNADKHHSVVRALLHSRGAKLSNRQIARYCGVHHVSVARIRAQLEASGAIGAVSHRLVERNGNTYEQDVRRIGVKRSARAPARSEHAGDTHADPQVAEAVELGRP